MADEPSGGAAARTPRRDLAGLTAAELGAWLHGEVGHSARFHRALYRQLMAEGRVAPAALPEWREAEATRPGLLARVAALAAGDQAPAAAACQRAEDPGLGPTTKLALALDDGHRVEAVHLPMAEGGHHTACVSSQVGCRMGCGFCLTATQGLARQLAAHEIVGQVLALQRATATRVRNVVFMGMGEPLDNPLAVAQAVRVLADPCGLGLARRHLTISTIGRPESLARLGAWGLAHVNLAVSLFAADDDLRSEFIPANRVGGLAALRTALAGLPLGRGRRVLLSVVVIPGVNDGAAAVDALIGFARGLPALVNLIPFNPIPGRPWAAPSPQVMAAVRDRLDAAGIPVRLRRTKGEAVMAACGQLGGRQAVGA